jgi:hypothetical protein
MSKLDKPTRIQINALLDLSDKGGFTTVSTYIINACKQLDTQDFITLDGFYCYPVKTLRDILSTYAKDSKIHVHPIVGWDKTFVEEFVEDNNKLSGKRSTRWAWTLHPHYNVIALREHGTPSIQRLYPTRREDITTHVAELTTENITETHNAIDKWIEKAICKDKIAITFHPDLVKSGGNIAADGYRIHYSDSAYQCEFSKRDECMQFITDGRKNDNVVTLDSKAVKQLSAGCKQALKIKATGIYLSVNGSLDYRATDGETEVTGNINAGYTHEGADILFYINARYLLDAISLPGQITIKIKHDNAPVYITDGSHEAIVMPLHMDK